MDADFDLYRLTDEHDAVRDAVRAVCTDKVAPHAAEVDATGTFPQASYDALRTAGSTPRTSRRRTAAQARTPSPPAWSSRRSRAPVHRPR